MQDIIVRPCGQEGEIVSINNNEQAIRATLDRLAGLVDEFGTGITVPRQVRDRARTQALEAYEACGPREGADALVLLGFATELLAAIPVDLAARPNDARRLIELIEQITGVPRVVLGRAVLRAPQRSQLAGDVAIEVHLELVLAFTGAQAVSLWTLWPNGDLRHISHAGDFDLDAPGTRRASRALLAGGTPDSTDRHTVAGIVIDCAPQPDAALLARGAPQGSDHRMLLLEAAAPVLRLMLEREELLARDSPIGPKVVTAVERRLARLRFDLHDGPQQDVHLLASDLALFREQLLASIANEPNAERLTGRLDDLAAQLVALDGDLRRLSSSFQSPFFHSGSLSDALSQITDAFAARTGIEPQTRLAGDLSNLTDSQQITLLALIREALSNARQHSEARKIWISISCHAGGIDARVTDDGRGFEPEATLVRAAREGHLGLVGMHERVRMLGGRTQIDSKPGGPSVISATLPRWPTSL